MRRARVPSRGCAFVWSSVNQRVVFCCVKDPPIATRPRVCLRMCLTHPWPPFPVRAECLAMPARRCGRPVSDPGEGPLRPRPGPNRKRRVALPCIGHLGCAYGSRSAGLCVGVLRHALVRRSAVPCIAVPYGAASVRCCPHHNELWCGIGGAPCALPARCARKEGHFGPISPMAKDRGHYGVPTCRPTQPLTLPKHSDNELK